MPWPPSPGQPGYPMRVAAWVCRLVPAELIRAVPSLSEFPRAAGRVSWYCAQATLTARGRDDGVPISLSAAIPPGALDGLLPEEDVVLLRGLQLDVDTTTPAETIRRRLEALARIGPTLPRHVSG